MSLEEIWSGTEDARNRQQELVEKKDAMDKMGVTSSEFKTAYEKYVNALNEAKKTAEDMDTSIDAMEAAVKDMGGDISPLEAARGELADLRTGFDVSADMLKMQGRVPITADIK